MKKSPLTMPTIALDEQTPVSHYSDGSELIPSEIPSEPQIPEKLVPGYTRDEEGIVNSYAVEPAMSAATYPTPKQQLRYVVWGTVGIVIVASLLMIALAVS